MITTGIESRVKIQDIVSNQIPSFVLNESPKFADFLKTYYISQEYQGGATDLSDNLDEYLKLDNLKPEVIVDSSTTVGIVTVGDETINVTSTKGFPNEYGLLKIGDEIITYTGITTNSFTGCVRGFSGITNYHQDLNKEELVFEESSASLHNIGASVQNLSSLFLKEFFEKTKYTFAPGFEGRSLAKNLDVGNFLKEIKSFYSSKGTDDSIEILLKVLFGKNGKSINLENYLVKSSDASFIRREVVVAEGITGNLSRLSGQTIRKKTDNQTRAVISEVEPFTRKGVLYFKLNLYVGYDDNAAVEGTFEITPTTKSLDKTLPGSSVISVDSTAGFDESGIIYSGNNIITYKEKTFNQFLGCSGIGNTIYKTDNVYSEKIYSGFEDGDATKECTFRITGVISDILSIDNNKVPVSEDQIIGIKYLGDLIRNPITKSYKEIFANSWIYNTSVTVDIESFSDTLKLKTNIDDSHFKIGDRIEIIDKESNNIVYPTSDDDIPFIVTIPFDDDGLKRRLQLNNFDTSGWYSSNRLYSIRRRINKASSVTVPIKYGNRNIISDIQNVYIEDGEDNFAYVASNGLPSSEFSDSQTYEMNIDGLKPPSVIDIDQEIYRYSLDQDTVNPLEDVDQETAASSGIQEFTTINFGGEIKFLTGDRVYYESESNPLIGLSTGSYYVKVLPGNEKIKLYTSRSHIASNSSSVKFRADNSGIGTHSFTLYQHKNNLIEPKKLFKKFSLKPNLKSGSSEETKPGATGMLVNGVEIVNYKTEEKVYYGPLTSISILNSGDNYDAINPPKISVASPNGGTDAKIQPVINGKLTDIIVDSNTSNFGIKEIISIDVLGGNGKGGTFDPVLVKKNVEMLFDARPVSQGGGISTTTPQLSFLKSHNLYDGQQIIYRNETQFTNVGVDGDGNGINDSTLTNNGVYYVKVDNNITVKLFENLTDYNSGINTVSFGQTDKYGGIQKFIVGEELDVLGEVKVLDPGSFTNRKLILNPIGINTLENTINFKNHNFETGDLIEYRFDTTSIGISTQVGLSTAVNYYVLKEDEDSFRICNAGIGGTVTSNFENKKYVKFTSSGVGYQYFKYPDITATISFVSVGNTSYTVDLTPVVKGSIVDAYLYEPGSGYGSEILNFEKSPEIKIVEGQKGQIEPIISSGVLLDTNIQFSGYDYFSPPDLILFDPKGTGSGAKLRAITENGEITNVIIENAGRGYSSNSRIEIINSGSGVIFESTVRSLDVNNVCKIDEKQYQVFDITDSGLGLKYGISGYYSNLRNSFSDNGSGNSKIIGWAYDGNPIYGPYGQSDPNVLESTTKRIESGYELDATNIIDRPSTSSFPLGFFIDDYVFKGNGDLDRNNGRFTRTNDFPNGVYAYYATIEETTNNPKFPYFIGNTYRTNTLKENILLDQKFDLNSSNLLRNTFPYKISELNADNDFLVESNEISKQRTRVESVQSGSIDSISIIKSGKNYQVNDKLVFNDEGTNGGGIDAKVSLIAGVGVSSIEQNITSYPESVVTWETNNKVKVFTATPHTLNSGDYVSISGISTVIPSPPILKLENTFKKILVDSQTVLRLENGVSSGSATTEIYVSNIPNNIRIGTQASLNNDSLTILNTFPNKNILRVKRSNPSSTHEVGSAITFGKYSFTIDEDFDIFDSKLNERIYFNPHESVGLGTTAGDSYDVSFDFGNIAVSRSIQMGSIYLENHKFELHDKVVLRTNSAAALSTIDTLNHEDSASDGDIFWIENVTPNSVGLTTVNPIYSDNRNIFFTNLGDNNDEYYLETVTVGLGTTQPGSIQLKADIDKITATVSVSTSHGLTNGDIVKLSVEPNLNVGIGTTATSVSVVRNNDLTIGINTVDSRVAYVPGLSSTPQTNPWVFTTSPQKHNFKNGDKVIYSHADGKVLKYGSEIFDASAWNLLATQKNPEMQDVAFYVRVLNETDFTVSETYDDVFKPSVTGSTTLSITNVPALSDLTNNGHIWALVNPKIEVTKGNNLVFDLTDTSLVGNRFKIYYDKEFKNEFISVGGTSTFSISGVGSAGITTNASVTINYSENIPEKLYYNLESSSGVGINTADKDVLEYNQICYIDSIYSGKHSVVGIGSTTDTNFTIALRKESERVSYTKSECKELSYNTSSSTAYGSIKEIDIISGGENYKKLPSISSINTKLGKGFEGVTASNTVGTINQVEIINDGFEYSSDKTLIPRAFVSPAITLVNSNTLNTIEVLDGGSNYVTSPDPVLVDFNTRQKVTGGLLHLNLGGESITSIDVEVSPQGIGADNELFVENNSNGISIQKVESDNTGSFVCILNTPVVGFSSETKLQVGDSVYIEGIQKFSSFGDGFNSSDLGYRFFTVTNYDSSQSEDRVTIDVSEYTSNTGIAKTIQDSSGTIVNKKNYPTFSVTSQPSIFAIGEKLLVNGDEVDLEVESHTNETDLKVIGTYDLIVGDKLVGKTSGNTAIISFIEKTDAKYVVDYSLNRSFGWKSNTGRLNEDYQVLPDNDYYQTLSYSIRSPLTWDELKSPINNLVHVSGMKNFSDTEIESNSDDVSGLSTATTEVDVFLDLIREQRVDTIHNFDNSRDIDVVNDKSKFLEFENSVFIPYTKAKTNVVLKIDDISPEFSQFEASPLPYRDIFEIESKRDYKNYIFKLTDGNNTQIQLTKLSIMSSSSGQAFINEQESLVNVGIGTSHIDGELYGEFSLVTTEFEETYLRFTPKNPYGIEYDVKYLEKRFGDSTVGIATTNIGCIDLISSVTGVTTGVGTRTLIDLDLTKHTSVVTDIHLNTLTSDKLNFVRLYATYDGTDNPPMAEYFYDSGDVNRSGEPIGIFTSVVESGRFRIKYINTEDTETVILRSRAIAFDSNSTTEDEYRFNLIGQPEGAERSVIYKSDYATASPNATGPLEIFSLNKNLFDAVSSVIEIEVTNSTDTDFNGSGVYEVSFIHDNTNTYSQTGPALYSTVSNSGIGTFGAELNGSNFKIMFYPFRTGSNTGIVKIRALSECFYSEVDPFNIPPDLQYGSLIESFKSFAYFALEGERINKKNFVLRNEKTPIFAKTFNPKDSSILNVDTGVFTIPNHYFSDGEELVYTPKSSFVGVGSTALEIAGGGGNLPTTVFAVVGDFEFDTFKLSTSKGGSPITGFSSTGEGNIHQLAMKESLSKAVISLDGMIQSPIAFTNISWALNDNIGGLISTEATTFALSGIQTVNVSDVLKIDDEFMMVRSVGLAGTSIGPITGVGDTSIVVVERGVLGTISTSHTDSTSVGVYKGSYNIIGDEVHFINAPKGNAAITRTENNLTFQTSEFSGRAFLRKDYSSNKIYDDVSNEFNGIGRTFTLTVNGNDGVGIGTIGGNGIVLINGVYQTPSADNNPQNNFEILEDESAGISSVRFTGFKDSTGQVGFSKTDVNANQIPRGGIIISIGSSGGLGYAPLAGAIAAPKIGVHGNIDSVVVGFGSTSDIKDVTDGYMISTATYNASTGVLEVTTEEPHKFTQNVSEVFMEGLHFECDSQYTGLTTTIFPDGSSPYGEKFPLLGITSATTFTVNVGTSTITHNYVGFGSVYSFLSDLTVGSGYRDSGGGVVSVAVTDLIYPHRFVSAGVNSITDNNGGTHTATYAEYDSPTGILKLTIPSHGLDDNNTIGIATGSLVFNCSRDNYKTQHAYPREVSLTRKRRGETGGDPAHDADLDIIAYTTNTISVGVGSGGGAGSGANITTTVGIGGTLTFAVGAGGTEYVNPQISVSEPTYSNLEVRGISRIGLGETTDTGVGLLMDIEVGAAATVGIGSTTSEVKGFKIKRPGYAFRKGDKFTPVGLVTAAGLSTPIEEIQFEVVETFDDTFSAWEFGNLDFIDSIKPYQDGVRTRFPLFYQGEVFSVQVAEESRMKVENALIVFINGVLQNPGENYFFTGGASFTLSEPAKVDDQIAIFFYRGTKGVDDEQVGSVVPTIERGDIVQINDYKEYEGQEERRVFDHKESDVLETSPYNGKGLYISDSTFRPISWTKQKKDLIVGGDFVFKTRRSLIGQVYPTTNIIKDVNVNDSVLYVENVDVFKFEIDNNSSSTLDDTKLLIVDDASEFVPAEISVSFTTNNDGLKLEIPNKNSTRGYPASTSFQALVPDPALTVRSGWPDTVPGKEGQPVTESTQLCLPPQGSTNPATFTINTDEKGMITTISSTYGTGYSTFSEVPQVSISLPPNVHELTPSVNTIHGFSGIVTAISASQLPNTTSNGRIIQFNDAKPDSHWEDIGVANGAPDSFTVTDSGGNNTGVDAQFTFKSIGGVLKEIEVTNPGTGYSDGDELIFNSTNLISGLSNNNQVRFYVETTLNSTDVCALEFKLQEHYLDKQKNDLNPNNFNISGQLDTNGGDYISISNTRVNPGSNEFAPLDTNLKSKLTNDNPITDANGGTQASYGSGDPSSNSKKSTPPAVSFASKGSGNIDAIYKTESLSVNAKTGTIISYAFIKGGSSNLKLGSSNNNLPLNIGVSGTLENGNFSWGKITLSSGVTTSYSISGSTVGIGLTEYPTIQRKTGGLRDTGALYAGPGVALTTN